MMGVWDPGEEKTVLSQIKKLIFASYRGLKAFRYLSYPGILLILILFLLIGCASFKRPWQKEEVVSEPNPLVIPPLNWNDTQNTIACIKLQPECNLD